MTVLGVVVGLARAEKASGQPGHADDVARLTILSLAWEAEARAWAEETGWPVIGHGLACRPDPTGPRVEEVSSGE